MFTLLWLGAGLVLGSLYLTYARWRRSGEKRVFGIGLVVAALIYFVFVWRAPDPILWVAIEAVGVVLFALIGIAGIGGSGWWLVVGWAMHPAWDFGLHYLGPGTSFVPASYIIACVAFDLLVAAYVGYAIMKANPSMQRTPAHERR